MSYVLLKNTIFSAPVRSATVKISFTDPISNSRVTKIFVLSPDLAINHHNVYHRMAVYHILRSDELNIKGFYLSSRFSEDPLIFTKLNINYQMLSSKYTAFICVVAVNTINPENTVKVNVAPISSANYSHQHTYRSSLTMVFIMILILVLSLFGF